jgi:NodT family efflux transporter outer membrane factor (OMF) lipoprotein
MYSKIKKTIAIGSVIAVVASCSVTATYEQPKDLQKDNLYRSEKSQDTTSMANLPWRALFKDSILKNLIATGLQQNYELKIAEAQMKSATASLKQSKLAFLPTLSIEPEVSQNRTSSAVSTIASTNYTLYDLTASSSWELDIWGKLNSTKKSYLASYLKSDAYKRAVQTTLISSIASSYYQLLAYDEQIAILEKTLKSREKEVEIVKALKEGAIVTGADVVNSEASWHAAEVQIPDLKQSRRELENSLSLLLAIPSDSIPRSKLISEDIEVALTTGVSSQLLANRPDVQAAEYSFRNAFELTNVAKTYFYPSLTISASGGWATANTLQSFFNGTFYGSVLGGLSQPIFNQGLNKQRLKTAQATQEEAYYNFQIALLTAGQEVSNALYSYQMAEEKQKSRTLQIIALEKASDFTMELLKYTTDTNYTDVLTAQQNLLAAQLNNISDKLQKQQAVIELYRALGGGWK